MREYLYRAKRKVGGKVRVSRQWKGRYCLPGDVKETEVALHTPDKSVAAEKLRAIVRAKRDEREGIVAPAALRTGAQKLLTDHVADFVADLKALGRDDKYVYNIGRLCRRVLADACWQLPKDVTADGFIGWRAGVAKELAAKTLNEYLNSLNALLNWMQREGRIIANPLRSVTKVETRGKAVRVRRALTDDEASRLVAVSGPRKVVYLAALLTGLRRSELEGLRWGDVHVDAVRPFLRVRASTTKNHLAADLVLRDDVAAALREIRPANVADDVPALADRLPDMNTFRADLLAAKIAEKDANGRVVDFHALRHTLATNLSRGGVAPRLAMKLMRHSDLRLTMNVYTDPELLEADDALARLARFDVQAGAVAVATGTYDNTEKDTEVAGVGRLSVSPVVTAPVTGTRQDHQQRAQKRQAVTGEVTACQKTEETPRLRLTP